MLRLTPPPRPRLLLAEDDPAERRALQLLLSGRGVEVRAYGSGKDVLTDPLTFEAHALITDYKMPDLNGLELLAALKAQGWEGRAVLITGFPERELSARALAAGFDAVIEKPASETALLLAVDRLMGRAA